MPFIQSDPLMLSESALSELVYTAARQAFTTLFQQHPDEHFYYCSLTTSGEACGPAFTAWSHEALDKAAAADPDPTGAAFYLKWSYGESPYFCFMDEEFFVPVRKAFQAHFALDGHNGRSELRMRAMEAAMHRLDAEGLFGAGPARDQIVIAVEVMPPDHTNTERVKRLNPAKSIALWMAENDNS